MVGVTNSVTLSGKKFLRGLEWRCIPMDERKDSKRGYLGLSSIRESNLLSYGKSFKKDCKRRQALLVQKAALNAGSAIGTSG
jgi:hypothetical protein